jgi:hypothetical protein
MFGSLSDVKAIAATAQQLANEAASQSVVD